MLVDGTGNEMPQSWRHFSGAMVRLAINDALNALPKEQTHVVWLAYFAGVAAAERTLSHSNDATLRKVVPGVVIAPSVPPLPLPTPPLPSPPPRP
jgi:hypothetical protein